MRCSPELRRSGSIFLTALCLLLLSQSVSARTWYVALDGSGDAPTIQAAINAAAVGDEILVGPGRYTWANQGGGSPLGLITVLRGKDDLTLRSEAGAGSTILDAQSQNRVLFIQGYNDMVVDGFTLTGGQAPPVGDEAGGGMATHHSGDVIRNCVFENNSAGQGGGIWCGGVSQLSIESCTFRYNDAVYGAAVLFINSSTTSTVRDCVMYDNIAEQRGGGVYGVNAKLEIDNTVFSRNRAPGWGGGAIFLRSMWPSTITGCTVSENAAPVGAGLDMIDVPNVTVERCIFAYQSGPVFGSASGSVATLSCNDVYGNTSNEFPAGTIDLGGNFSEDPQFCGVLGSGDFALSSASPCAPGNHPDESACDLIGARAVNCGQVRTEAHSWGHIKALYQ